jgi:alanyl-tRNA synthetase
MKSIDLRKKFFDFFIARGHTKVASSPLIPAEDPTLLFTNAGMNQFKDVFLGKETRSYTRATSIQKCMRAGGKHSDLDNVGFTNRHLTFFEMMGNFSFGDYFKKEAIRFAWDFLTKEVRFNPETLHASVFREDNESYDIWRNDIGLEISRIVRLGEADNFWQMGDTGPCGPCSEIYVDRGIQYGCGQSTCKPGCSCDRFLEVWNLVFMQFDRQPDGTDIPLKQKGVDTGMGLERLCFIIQQKKSVFETDLFEGIIKKTEELTGHSYNESPQIRSAFNVIADHIRAATFLIADGATPSNEGRGYVLRKIIRRAALFAQKLTNKNIFPALSKVIIQEMSSLYPELTVAEKSIDHLLTIEVDKFATNLIHGKNLLEKYFKESTEKKVTGQEAFKLYDTYGFPLELTRVIAHEHGFDVDIEGFEKYMEQQRERSTGKAAAGEIEKVQLPDEIKTEFVGYQQLETESPLIALICENQLIETAPMGSEVWVITQQTPFFVEKGGQISDKGWVIIEGIKTPIINLKRIQNAIAVQIITPKNIRLGDIIKSTVDQKHRLDTMNNHTATHLLQAALIQTLGKEVRQSGSLVHPDYLRFDFTYHKPLTSDQIKHVEDLVNEKIRENIPVSIYETTYKDALEKGVIAIFGEKYNPEKVRVIDVPSFSKELCGGTHVRATGDIGAFKITEESALSAGQRRIVALTGRGAIELFQQNFETTKKLCQEFKVQHHELLPAIEKQREQLKESLSIIKKLKKEAWKGHIAQWINQIKMINSIPFSFVELTDYGPEELKDIAQELVARKPGFYFLLSQSPERSSFFAIISKELINMINMKQYAEWLKEQFSLRGGVKETVLQGGGPVLDTQLLQAKIVEWLQQLK